MPYEDELVQKFTVTIKWSPESEARLTEGDLHEVIEEIATEVDEDCSVDVSEQIE